MALIRQVGITPQELDELVDEERWRQWCLTEPDLARIGSLQAVRELRGEAEDQALGALLRLAAADGHDDQLAAVAVLHQLGGSVRTIARHFWHLAGGDVEGIVVGAIWEQIRSYDWRSRRRYHASAIHHGTRKAVRAALMPDTSRTLGRRVVLLNPQSWAFEALAEHDETSGMSLDAFDSRDQLAIFLHWAIGQGVVDDEEIGELAGHRVGLRANHLRMQLVDGEVGGVAKDHQQHYRQHDQHRHGSPVAAQFAELLEDHRSHGLSLAHWLNVRAGSAAAQPASHGVGRGARRCGHRDR